MRPHLRSFVAAALVTAAAVVPSVVSASPTGGALPPVLINVHPVAGEYGIPDDATMVAATVTAIRPADRGWIKVYPCDQDEPTTANLNYEAEQVINNLVLSRIADDGTICVATFAIADYVIDLAGYVPAGSDIIPYVTPLRVLNTRKDGGPSPLADGTTTVLDLGSTDPTGNQLSIFNLTAVSRDTFGHVTVYPCDEEPGATSSVNFSPGRAVANLVVTRLGADGTVCFRNKNEVGLIVDLAAFGTDGITTLPTPKRILNTRNTPGLVPAGTTTVDPDLPTGATAAIYNLTVVGATAPGHATAYSCDQPPKASNVNYPAAVAAGAASITELDPTGHFCVYTLTPAELIIDLIGYTTGTADYVPLTPVRLHDTRKNWAATCTTVEFASWDEEMQLIDLDPESGIAFDYWSLGSDSAPNRFATPPQTFRDECGAVYFYVTTGFGGGAAPGLHRFSRPSPTAPVRHDVLAPAIDSVNFPIIGLTKLGGSGIILGYSSNGATWDLLTGEQINEAIDGFVSDDDDLQAALYLPPLTMSENGSVIVSAYPTDSGQAITVWDWYSETLDGVILLDAQPRWFTVSPDGKYVAVWPKEQLAAGSVVVYSRFGDEVDRFAVPLRPCPPPVNPGDPACPPPTSADVRWIGNGELAIIERGRDVYRRPMFGDPVLVNSATTFWCQLRLGCTDW